MAKKSEIEKRRKQLLTELEQHPEGLSYTELELLLNKKKRTIAADVEELRKSGSEIIIKKDKLYLQHKGNVVAHSNKQTARRLALLLEADAGMLKHQHSSSEKISAHNTEKHMTGHATKRIDLRDKTREADLQILLHTGMLQIDDNEYRLGWSAPKHVYFKDYELEILYRLIQENSAGYVYQQTLKEIAEQIQDAMQYKLLYDKQAFSPHNITMEKKWVSDTVMNTLVQILGKVDFRSRIIRINYEGPDGQIMQRKIAAGMLLYSIDHVKVYMLAKEYFADAGEEITILDIQKICAAIETEQKNTCYLSAEFFEIFDEMYSISIEPCQDVEVIFDDIFNIREKIERLAGSRKFATVSAENGKLIYRDRIRGINDFAKYLRSFGMSCRAVKPDILVEKLYHSACRIYDLYQDEEAT